MIYSPTVLELKVQEQCSSLFDHGEGPMVYGLRAGHIVREKEQVAREEAWDREDQSLSGEQLLQENKLNPISTNNIS